MFSVSCSLPVVCVSWPVGPVSSCPSLFLFLAWATFSPSWLFSYVCAGVFVVCVVVFGLFCRCVCCCVCGCFAKMPTAWLHGEGVEVYLVSVQTWRVQRPSLTPPDIGMFIHEHGRPPLDCVQFFMPM